MKTISVTVDCRERGSGVIEALAAEEGVMLKVERLRTGDYLVGRDLAFERKTVKDLATSVVQGRFFTQVNRLASSCRRGVIILEGTGGDLAHTSVKREALQGALINASVFMGLAILRSYDPRETAKLMLYAGRQAEKMICGGLYRHGYRPKGRRKKQIFILQGLPGVGPDRAESLLDAFGSVGNILNAPVEELVKTPGIGRKTAEGIRYVLSETPSPYRLIHF